MTRFAWTQKPNAEGELVWYCHDSQTGETISIRDMGGMSTDYTWPAFLAWKAQSGSEDPTTDFLREAKMYPGDYVKELAVKMIADQARFYTKNRFLISLCRRVPHKVIRDKLLFWWWKKSIQKAPKRWLWLCFKYGMLVNPMAPAGLHPFHNITYNSLLQGTYVVDRDKFSTKFWLWLTVITFRIYMKIPNTQYQDWKRNREELERKNKELRQKHISR